MVDCVQYLNLLILVRYNVQNELQEPLRYIVVAEPRQSGPIPPGWETVGQTDYLLYIFR